MPPIPKARTRSRWFPSVLKVLRPRARYGRFVQALDLGCAHSPLTQHFLRVRAKAKAKSQTQAGEPQKLNADRAKRILLESVSPARAVEPKLLIGGASGLLPGKCSV